MTIKIFFFTAAFLTLFLFGIGKHLAATGKQEIDKLLTAWAQWILSYHTQR